MADARILLGDCIAVMQTLEAESIDAVVCDPPYGIEFMGRDWDKFIPHDEVEMSPRWAHAQRGDPSETHWGDGEAPKYGKLPSFGGRRTSFQCQGCGKRDAFRNPHKCDAEGKTDWRVVPSYAGASPDVLAFEQFSKAWATEAYRVLKPGGHLLAFGATRMYHRLAAGIEDAGFEIRDSLHWIYGSGFPKSLDVSKSIDAKAGVERPDRVTSDYGSNEVFSATKSPVNKGTPVTEDAKKWDGWGTALKPAHEPIVMARKPLSGTVAETVVAHGTGALNIDATRPGGEPGSHAVERPKGPTDGATDFPASATVREPVEGGRWPANIILSHLPDCEGSGPTHTEVLCAPCQDVLVERCDMPDGSTFDVLAAEEGIVLAALNAALRDLPAGSRSSGNGNAQASEPTRARPASSPTDSQGGCPACPRSGDALARLDAEDDRGHALQLADALALFLDLGPSPEHSPAGRSHVLPSSDASLPPSQPDSTHPSRTAEASPPASPLESAGRNARTEPLETSSDGPSDSKPASSTCEGAPSSRATSSPEEPGSDRHTRCTADLCRPAAARLLREVGRHLPLRLVSLTYRTGCPVAELNEASGTSASRRAEMPLPIAPGDARGEGHGDREASSVRGYDDVGGAARFFYIAKPRRRERIGGTIRNLHPTVKPIDLMRHLVRLVTPPGGTVLDPFLGSGSTGCAAMAEGVSFIGIENDPASHETSLARIADYAHGYERERPTTE